MVKISPSILAGNFLCLKDEVKRIEKAGADTIHFDIMDGVYVPNITFGFKFLKSIKSITSLPADVHLMIIDPAKYIEEFVKAGANLLIFHYETVKLHIRVINEIRKHKCKVGVSINPSTPVSILNEIIAQVDTVLLMSVEPGFYGQKFIEGSYERIRELKHLITNSKSHATIIVDGGVSFNNYKQLIDAGTDVFVIGNDFFKHNNHKKYIKIMKQY